ncbi:hypothetical protein DY000_02003913 [Brassica cretica]|uniref:Uncharacterized protein n=1 Tax=Brassica cretica TaxID=69181 RepID=A0ABQ7C8S9_BRACR|nr:hypothetical protein DY000_02003913 [Brassica cretica]
MNSSVIITGKQMNAVVKVFHDLLSVSAHDFHSPSSRVLLCSLTVVLRNLLNRRNSLPYGHGSTPSVSLANLTVIAVISDLLRDHCSKLEIAIDKP